MNDVLPACGAPECRETPVMRFLGGAQLCPEHAARAHRRAGTNVLVFGVAFVAFGGVALAVAQPGKPVFFLGAALAASGLLLAFLAPLFHRAAKRHED